MPAPSESLTAMREALASMTAEAAELHVRPLDVNPHDSFPFGIDFNDFESLMLSSSGANTNGKKTVQAAPALSINNTGGPGVDLAVSSLNLDSSERSAPSMQSLRQKRQQLLAKLRATRSTSSGGRTAAARTHA